MSESELWSVAIAPDNIQSMTLDQLDEAFQRGLITENAMVWTEGMDEWQRLREVLGDDEPVAAAPAPVVAAAPVAYAQPQQFSQAQHAQQAQSFPPAQVRQAQPMAALPSAPTASAPMSLPPQSTAPVALNLSDDLELSGFGAPKKSKWGYIAAAAVVLGGVGFTVAASSGGGAIDPSKASAAAAPRPVSPDQEPLNIPVTKSPDAPLSEGGGYKISAAEEAKFKVEEENAAEQRAKVAAALAAKPAEVAAPAAKPGKRGRSGGGRAKGAAAQASSPIKKGGSKFDPLNGALP